MHGGTNRRVLRVRERTTFAKGVTYSSRTVRIRQCPTLMSAQLMAASCLLVLAASSPPRQQTLLSTSLDTLSTSLDTPQWTALEEIAPTLESHGRNVSAPTLAAPTSNGDVEKTPSTPARHKTCRTTFLTGSPR